MDCTHCEPVLLDLCYGELTSVQEREVRAHIADCPHCRKALARLEAGQALARHLADETPPPELTERLLQAARAHTRRSVSPFERVQAWVEAMARLAMTRQFAMATLSLLVVVVGLWSVPELTRRREARPESVVVEAPRDEVGPSREVAAASPQPTALSAEPMPAAEGSGALGRSAPERKKSELAANKRSARTRGDVLQPEAAEMRGRFAEPPPALSDAKARPAPTKPVAAAKLEAPPEPADALVRPREQSAARRPSKAAADEELNAAPAAAPAAAVSSGATQSNPLDEMFQVGMTRYRAEDYAGAAQQFARMLESNTPSGQRAAALLYLARSERALGHCDRALRSYETLVRSYGSSQQSVAALSEGVACYDQLGDAPNARRLLEHATTVPSLAAQAQQLLSERGASAKPRNP